MVNILVTSTEAYTADFRISTNNFNMLPAFFHDEVLNIVFSQLVIGYFLGCLITIYY